MRALKIKGARDVGVDEISPPPAPAADEIQVRVRAVALNHIDVWGWRGMAFAKRKLPIVAGAEAAGEIVAWGEDVTGFSKGQIVCLYGAKTCGHCTGCLEGRLFDGIARHSPEGLWFRQRAQDVGFKQAVKERDSGAPIAKGASKTL